MEKTLNEYQNRILAEGIINGGYLRIEVVYRLYSSEDSAKASIMTLESWGFISLTDTPGIFRVIKAPDSAWIIAENLKEARKKAKEATKR